MKPKEGRFERGILLVNTAIVVIGMAYLLGSPDSLIRRPISRYLDDRAQAIALAAMWPAVSKHGAWFNSPETASLIDTIVVFSDYQCPYCRQLHTVLVELQQKHQLPVVRFRHLPVASHSHAKLAARIAICADEAGDFAPVHRYLMERTAWLEWDSDTVIAHLPVRDKGMLLSCLASHRAEAVIAADSTAAAELHLVGTPSIISRLVVVVGSISDEQLAAWRKPRSLPGL